MGIFVLLLLRLPFDINYCGCGHLNFNDPLLLQEQNFNHVFTFVQCYAVLEIKLNTID